MEVLANKEHSTSYAAWLSPPQLLQLLFLHSFKKRRLPAFMLKVYTHLFFEATPTINI